MMSPKYNADKFWNERCRKLGHTGWANDLLYRYDQHLRLRAVEKALSQARISINEETRVLDIGCGTGDFIELLAKKGASVIGIDISQEVTRMTKKRFEANSKVQISTGKVEDLELPPDSRDLVTSITVLQHIVEESLFLSAVRNVINAVKKGGHILCLESSPYEKPKGSSADYVAIRTHQEWIDTFWGAGCSLINEFTYPQWGIMLLERLNRLLSMVLPRWRRKSDDRQGAVFPESLLSKGLLHLLYNLRARLILGIAYPIDHWFFISTPSKWAEYRILLFKKQ